MDLGREGSTDRPSASSLRSYSTVCWLSGIAPGVTLVRAREARIAEGRSLQRMRAALAVR